MLRVVHIRNKKRTDWQTWNFTNMINSFGCYVIKSAGEIAKKVLLSIVWYLLLIEINLSQIRISDSKREKVCAVCPYLLFLLSSDVRSEGCISIKKISTSIFSWFLILHHSHSLKMCFRKKWVCLFVCVCLSVCPSPIVEPKPIDRSRSNSISRVLL